MIRSVLYNDILIISARFHGNVAVKHVGQDVVAVPRSINVTVLVHDVLVALTRYYSMQYAVLHFSTRELQSSSSYVGDED